MPHLLLFVLSACAPDGPESGASAARVGSLPSSVLTAPEAGRAMAAGDLNGDGVIDIAATTQQGRTPAVQVWYGVADATFAVGPLLAVPGAISGEFARRTEHDNRPSLAVVDLQGDGVDDLVLCWANTGDDAWAWFGGPAGPSGAISHPHLGRRLSNAGDTDGDGLDDLYVVDLFEVGESSVYSVREVILDQGQLGARFAFGANFPWFLPTASYPWWLAVPGDLDVDGKDDLAVGFRGDQSAFTGKLELHPGDATGVLATPSATWVHSGYEFYDSLAPARGRGDLTGDGVDDLVVLQRDYVDAVRVYPGAPGGLAADPAFALTAPTSERTWADDALIAGDLDGDGATDLLVASDVEGRGRVYRYRSEGGQLQPMPDLYWQGDASDARLGIAMVALGDMDGDGAAEVAISEPGTDSILIVRGSPGDGCAPGDTPALRYDDVDLDGVTSAWSPRATCGLPASPHGGDCDDLEAGVHPGAIDVGLMLDFDCDGVASCPEDADHDGYGSSVFVAAPTHFCANPILHTEDTTTDCDDTSSLIHPGATDWAFNTLDEDCDGVTMCYSDRDADGYRGYPAAPGVGCGGPATDCDDSAPEVHPGAVEVPADEVDSDCDGEELCFQDLDLDGWGAGLISVTGATCSWPDAASRDGDCDDAAALVFPGTWDQPDNGVDADCDGTDRPDLRVSRAAGRALELDYDDVTRRGRVYVLASRLGAGAGPCLPWMGGACSGLQQPTVVWQGRAPPLGSGTLRLQPPRALSGARVAFELWSVEGAMVAASDVAGVVVP